MKNFDPRVKLLWVLLCTTGALVFLRPFWLLGLVFFTLLGTFFFGTDLKAVLWRVSRFLSLLLMIGLIHLLFTRTGDPLLTFKGYVLVTTGGALQGMQTLLRFFVILCAAAVMASENIRRVLAALNKLKVPYLFSFMLLIALRFIPTFSVTFSDALVALQLRGVDLKKVPLRRKLAMYGDLLLPVVADAVVKSRQLAIVMEARGFGAFETRTNFLEVRMTLLDGILTVVLISLGIFAFVFYFVS